MLEPDECPAIVAELFKLRAFWSPLHPKAPCFTLGVSAYIEAQTYGAVPYTLAARKQNPHMRERFGAVYERVRATLEAKLGEPVEYSHRLALPGFQIFLSDPVFSIPVCSIHIDEPYFHLEWPDYEAVDRTQTLSFTLALQLPSGGGGLNLWPEIPLREGALAAKLVEGKPPTFCRYALGKMALHDGHTIHQIAPFSVSAPGEARITLQGHAIRSARGWIAYF